MIDQLHDYDPSGLDIAEIDDNLDHDTLPKPGAADQKLTTDSTGVNCTNFRNMLLKPELNKAI